MKRELRLTYDILVATKSLFCKVCIFIFKTKNFHVCETYYFVCLFIVFSHCVEYVNKILFKFYMLCEKKVGDPFCRTEGIMTC